MKSKDFFPCNDRDIRNTNVVMIKVCDKTLINSHITYVNISQYCKAIDALEMAEKEIQELTGEIRKMKISQLPK
jgi:hypothetical protein